MKNGEIIEYLRSIAPEEKAAPWDRPGLMLGSLEGETEGVLFAMDFTREVLDEALERGMSLVITHHPFVWDPMKRIDVDGAYGALVADAIKNDITVYSAHTNLDFAEGGINDALAEAVGITGVLADESGCHRYGDLFQEITFAELAEFVGFALNAPNARTVIPAGKNPDDPVKRIGVSSGGFDGDYDWLREYGIDAIVTGEMKHNEAIELRRRGFFAIAAGHFESEQPGVVKLAEETGRALGIKTYVTEKCNPFA